MDVAHSCRCCLRRAPDKDLTTPYTHLGTREIYSDMLKECFEIHVILGDNGECGICEVCVDRLREASDFKLQVQRSQAELQRLQATVFVKGEKFAVKIEVGDDGTREQESYEEPMEESAMVHENNRGHMSNEDPLLKMEKSDGDVTGDEELASEPDPSGGAGADTSKARSGEESSSYTGEQKDKQKTFQCKVCDKTFVNNSVLKRHKILHTAKKSFKCDQCNKQFSRKDGLHDHRKIHVGDVFYECDVCNKQFKVKRSLNAHVKIHFGNKPYSCEACGMQFVRKAHFDKHKATITYAEAGPHICVKCDKKFAKKCALIRHQIIHAADSTTCTVCNKEFTSNGALNRHMKIHTGEKSYSCEVCNKRFLRQQDLQGHKRTHAVEETFPCDVCNKQLSKRSLRRHKKKHAETGETKKHKCEECNKEFRFQSCLNRHKLIHTGEKPFSCKECNKQFTRKGDLDRHSIIHLKDKPYSCELCTKKFTQKALLIMHERIHTGEKPFECDVCQAKFARKVSLIKHILHTKSNCHAGPS